MRYLTQLALAAEENGFEYVLAPTGLWCQDPFTVASVLTSLTTTVKFLVAVRPTSTSPTFWAQQVQTLQRFSGNRIAVNIVVGGEDHEQRAFGDSRTKAQRYQYAEEAIAIARHLWENAEPLDYSGEQITVEGAALAQQDTPAPSVFFGGSSPEGIRVAARQANVYLTWGDRPEGVRSKIATVQDAAAQEGRSLEYGIRLHTIARPTEKEAWEVAQRLIDAVDPAEVRRIQEGLARSQSEGQRLQSELHERGAALLEGSEKVDARELLVAPNLWAGVGLLRGGAGTALVGSYAQVAERLAEYQEAGLQHAVLSGYPCLEEAYHVGEGVVPELQKLGVAGGRRQKG